MITLAAIARHALRFPRPRVARRVHRLAFRRRSLHAILALAIGMAAVHLGMGAWLDRSPQAHDPEYGLRLARLRARTTENPGRPLVLALGSSRAAMGVRPAVLEPAPGRPLVLNFSLVGSGPIMELLAFRRAIADGVKPDAVLIEYWPPVWCERGPYHEAARFDPHRIRDVDADTVREFFPDPAGTERVVREFQRNPVYGYRRPQLNRFVPSLLPQGERSDSLWRIDDWGWLPGRVSATAEEIEAGRRNSASYYEPLFSQYEVSPVADAALRKLISECRERGIPAALVYFPETSAFRAFATPAALEAGHAYLARIQAELNLPLIDARHWMPDGDLLDGFHLTQSGAAAFTRKLAPAIDATFPELAR